MSKVAAIKTPQIIVDLGGRQRTILYDLNSFAELELIYGSVEKAMNKLQSGSVVAARDMLWAGLIHDEAVIDEVTGEPIKYNITRRQVGSWLGAPDIERLGGLINDAMTQSLVQPEQKPAAVSTAPEGVAKVELTAEEKAEQAKNV
ncbi:hypothetical protein D3C71_234970 [compost metagenome]